METYLYYMLDIILDTLIDGVNTKCFIPSKDKSRGWMFYPLIDDTMSAAFFVVGTELVGLICIEDED